MSHFAIIGGSAWRENRGRRAFALFNDVEGLENTIAMPNLCVDSTPAGFEAYRHYIYEHLDPQSFQELAILDRWWLAALNISDRRFGQVLEAYHSTFRSPSVFQVSKPRYPSATDELRYCGVVRQVLEAPHTFRQTFLTWLCGMGTAKALKPFINAGFNFRANRHGPPGAALRSYLCVAAAFRNNEIIEALRAAGTTLDTTLMGYCLPHRLRSMEDVDFVHALISSTLPTPKEYTEEFPFSPIFQCCSTFVNTAFDPTNALMNKFLLAGMGSYSHPPFSRQYYLGPELLLAILLPGFGDTRAIVIALLQLGASLDYAGPPKTTRPLTALEWAANLGYHEYVLLLCHDNDGYGDRRAALQSALTLTERNMASSHPRQCPITSPCEMTNWPFDAMRGAFDRKHHAFGGVTLAIDLQCHRLILSTLLDLRDGYSTVAELEKTVRIQVAYPEPGPGHPG